MPRPVRQLNQRARRLKRRRILQLGEQLEDGSVEDRRRKVAVQTASVGVDPEVRSERDLVVLEGSVDDAAAAGAERDDRGCLRGDEGVTAHAGEVFRHIRRERAVAKRKRAVAEWERAVTERKGAVVEADDDKIVRNGHALAVAAETKPAVEDGRIEKFAFRGDVAGNVPVSVCEVFC